MFFDAVFGSIWEGLFECQQAYPTGQHHEYCTLTISAQVDQAPLIVVKRHSSASDHGAFVLFSIVERASYFFNDDTGEADEILGRLGAGLEAAYPASCGSTASPCSLVYGRALDVLISELSLQSIVRALLIVAERSGTRVFSYDPQSYN